MGLLKLNNQTQLSWAEYGLPDGEPVFYFHGMPGSRLEAQHADNIARDLGLRLIVPERPSYGDSDPQENFTPLDWPVILTQLADSLQIDRFSILSFSGGGIYAFACAHTMPERIKHISILSGPAPFETAVMQNTINADFKPLYELAASNFNAAIEHVSQMVTSPEVLFAIMEAALPPEDKAIFNDKHIRKSFLENLTLAIKNGTTGFVNDLRCFASPWGFEFEDIESDIDIWHGDCDKNIDFSAAEYLVAPLKNTSTHFLHNEGHYYFFRDWREILENIKSKA